MNNQKGIASTLAIIIVIGVIAIGGVLAYQYLWVPEEKVEEEKEAEAPKDETADWKVYRNEEYGFEVKYPNNLERCFADEEHDFIAIAFPVSTSDIPDGWDADYFKSTNCMYGSLIFKTEIANYSDVKELKEYYWSLYEERYNCDPEVQIEETLFMDIPALRIGACDPMGQYHGTYTIFIYNHTKFSIEVSDSFLEKAGDKLTTDIISTFKFIEIKEPEESYIKVISPNGGEEWEVRKTYKIEWVYEGDDSTLIDIRLLDGESGIITIASKIPANQKYYFWFITDKIDSRNIVGWDEYYIGLKLNSNKTSFSDDRSDNYFSIIDEDKTADWKTYNNDELGYQFQYPEELDTQYMGIHSPDWLPEVSIASINPDFICEEIEPSLAGSQKEVTINDTTYCVFSISSPTAGSSYSEFKYTVDKDNKQLTFDFTLRYSHCGVFYGIDNKVEECEKEQQEFDVDAFIDEIFSTFKFID